MIEYQEKELKEEGKCLSCNRIITNKGSIVCPCCTRNGVKTGGTLLTGALGVISTVALGKKIFGGILGGKKS